jgi:hypothetical protein
VEGPSILELRVLNGRIAEVELPKFSSPVQAYLVDGDTAEVLLRVQDIDSVEASVTINARTDFGHFEGRLIGEGYVLVKVELPADGSRWEVPGPGAAGSPQIITLSSEQPLLLQISGWAGPHAAGDRPEAGASTFVMRQD